MDVFFFANDVRAYSNLLCLNRQGKDRRPYYISTVVLGERVAIVRIYVLEMSVSLTGAGACSFANSSCGASVNPS